MILVNSASSKVIQVNFHSPLVKSLFSSAPNCKMCVAVKLVEVESSGTCEIALTLQKKWNYRTINKIYIIKERGFVHTYELAMFQL